LGSTPRARTAASFGAITMIPSTAWAYSASIASSTSPPAWSDMPATATPKPLARAARSIARSVEPGPNSRLSKLSTPIRCDLLVTSPRAKEFGR
jgi:hypothetical protein